MYFGGKKWIAFLRHEFQGSNLLTPEVELAALTGTRSALRIGALIQGPFKALPDDIFAFGLAWGVPSQSLAKDSYVAEFLYRFQVQDTAQLSFSLQVIQSSTVFEQVLVFSARYRFTF